LFSVLRISSSTAFITSSISASTPLPPSFISLLVGWWPHSQDIFFLSSSAQVKQKEWKKIRFLPKSVSAYHYHSGTSCAVLRSGGRSSIYFSFFLVVWWKVVEKVYVFETFSCFYLNFYYQFFFFWIVHSGFCVVYISVFVFILSLWIVLCTSVCLS
jgi:hypothetical protein